MLSQFQGRFEEQCDRYTEEWREFLAFPSISADPAHAADCLACAQWLAEHLRTMGMQAELLETPAKPVVYAERQGNPDAPTVLLYGHYDVQPVDPLEAWETPPFEPTLTDDGRMVARGAVDNKGQILYALKAVETLIKGDRPAPTIKIVIEGEEECGSEGISAALPAWRDKLQADILVVTDTSMAPSGVPAVIMGLRGVVHLTASLSGPQHDLHSGVHGGVAPNPAAAMARMVASLHGPDGSVAVEGFYDGVEPPSDRERSLAAESATDPADYQADTGVAPVGGEQAYTAAERAGFRPTVEVNGIHSGYGGAGMKTIIPAEATAKITARLVPGQDPAACLDAIIRHLEKHTPPGLQLDVPEKGVGGPGLRLDVDCHLAETARNVLDEVSGKSTVFMWEGASIPIVAELAKISGARPLLAGFGLEEDRVHAPNESFALDRFRLGYLYVATFLERLGCG